MPRDRRTSRLGALLVGCTGWMYLAVGAVPLAAVALIPAHEELDRARTIQAKAEAAVERRETLRRDAADRLAALADPSDALLASLAQTHLNLAPAGSRPLSLSVRYADPPRAARAADADEAPPRSRLATLATGRPSRSLLIVLGAVCVLVGLLPAADRRRERRPVRGECEINA